VNERTKVDGYTFLNGIGPLPCRVCATANAKWALVLGDDLGNARDLLCALGKNHAPRCQGGVGRVVGLQAVVVLGSTWCVYLAVQLWEGGQGRTLLFVSHKGVCISSVRGNIHRSWKDWNLYLLLRLTRKRRPVGYRQWMLSSCRQEPGEQRVISD
jgi:hypothetical protein